MSCEIRTLVPLPIPRIAVTRLVNRALRMLRYPLPKTNVSLAFIDDRRMRRLNQRYRHHSETTDVLSFEGAGTGDLGEILISVPQARRQAKQYGHALRSEIELLIVHGLLHLAGYDHHHPADRRRMQRRENQILDGRSLIRRSTA